ncbi:MAG: HAD hydrolase-like protein [Oscillospiraceae bacterium]|nr:HAD hydrolase-like protein [Oscillospiraceae bacterium]
MRSYNCIIFDLDGTLTDPGEGITRSVAYALGKYGYAVENLRSLNSFIGPPLRESFQDYCGFDADTACEAIMYYRERFLDVGWRENAPYEGILGLLRALTEKGKTLIVATSKPEPFAVRILEHFGFAKYFSLICGASLNELDDHSKAYIIAQALSRAGNIDPRDAVMVGDRAQDIAGAHANGMKAIGVLYGYGSRKELTTVAADRLAETVEDLKALLI